MTRLIDADALAEQYTEMVERLLLIRANIVPSHVTTLIINAPTIDAVEVVRCKDCRYQVHCYQTVSHNKIHDGFKEYWSEPIEFCSKGKAVVMNEQQTKG